MAERPSHYRILASGLGRRLLLRVMLCAVLPLAVLAWIGREESYSRVERQGQIDLDREARLTVHSIYDRLAFLQADLKDLVDTAGDLNEDLAGGIERRHEHLSSRFDRIWLDDGSTKWILLGDKESRPPEANARQMELFNKRKAMLNSSGDGVGSEVWLAIRGSRWDREMIWGQINASYLWNPGFLTPGVDLVVFGDRDEILFETIGMDNAAALRSHLQNVSSERFFEWERSGHHYAGSRRRVLTKPNFGVEWDIAVARDRNFWFAPLAKERDRSILLGFLALLLVVLVTSEQIRRMLVPIQNLQQAMTAVEEQRYDQPVVLHSGDELEELGNAFNRMTVRLAKITKERDQVEASLVKSRDRAITAARLETEFLANVSHELRTPMTSIRSFAEILREYGDEDKESREEFLDIIVTESERLTRMIEQILNFSKIQSGTESWEFVPLDLGGLLSGVCKGMDPVAAGEGVEICTDFAADMPEIVGDDDRLRQVWINLISNAIKFSPEGSVVSVRARAVHGGIAVEVEDQGPGIHQDDQGVIFERFRQACADILTEKPRGTGLGLAIAGAIIARHHGHIEVESEVGSGAIFRVTLPELDINALEAEVLTPIMDPAD